MYRVTRPLTSTPHVNRIEWLTHTDGVHVRGLDCYLYSLLVYLLHDFDIYYYKNVFLSKCR